MKPRNIPPRIFLQIGDILDDQEVGEIDFESYDDQGNITWSSDRVFDRDIEYVLAKPRSRRKKGGRK